MVSQKRYPIYIISKGRHESRLTSKALESMGVDYKIVVEPQEESAYAKVINRNKILVLPFSNLGQGSIPARNWVWDHSRKTGAARHWILDDNIAGFRLLKNHKKVAVSDRSTFDLCEQFVDRYQNIHMAGMQYSSMCVINSSTAKGTNRNPFTLNTRIYSCILLSDQTKERWRGRYNEDTDLSIRIMQSGACTLLFNGFLCDKQATMTMKGGNTDQLYVQDKDVDGRLEMARHLQRQHPSITQIVRKWGRWQHSVNYSQFKGNNLIRVRKLD